MQEFTQNSSLNNRVIQGHTGGSLTAPELMGHVAIPFKWKEFLFDRGCSFDVTSILKSGRKRKQRKKADHLNPFGDNPDEEEPDDDLSKPRTMHYQSKWKSRQDAVYWSPSTRKGTAA